MSQQDISTRAKQGDPKVIEAILKRYLHPKGIHPQVARQDACLHVLLETEQSPQPDAIVDFIHAVLLKLGTEPIETLKVYSRSPGQTVAWSRDVQVNPRLLIDTPELEQVSPDADVELEAEPDSLGDELTDEHSEEPVEGAVEDEQGYGLEAIAPVEVEDVLGSLNGEEDIENPFRLDYSLGLDALEAVADGDDFAVLPLLDSEVLSEDESPSEAALDHFSSDMNDMDTVEEASSETEDFAALGDGESADQAGDAPELVDWSLSLDADRMEAEDSLDGFDGGDHSLDDPNQDGAIAPDILIEEGAQAAEQPRNSALDEMFSDLEGSEVASPPFQEVTEDLRFEASSFEELLGDGSASDTGDEFGFGQWVPNAVDDSNLDEFGFGNFGSEEQRLDDAADSLSEEFLGDLELEQTEETGGFDLEELLSSDSTSEDSDLESLIAEEPSEASSFGDLPFPLDSDSLDVESSVTDESSDFLDADLAFAADAVVAETVGEFGASEDAIADDLGFEDTSFEELLVPGFEAGQDEGLDLDGAVFASEDDDSLLDGASLELLDSGDQPSHDDGFEALLSDALTEEESGDFSLEEFAAESFEVEGSDNDFGLDDLTTEAVLNDPFVMTGEDAEDAFADLVAEFPGEMAAESEDLESLTDEENVSDLDVFSVTDDEAIAPVLNLDMLESSSLEESEPFDALPETPDFEALLAESDEDADGLDFGSLLADSAEPLDSAAQEAIAPSLAEEENFEALLAEAPADTFDEYGAEYFGFDALIPKVPNRSAVENLEGGDPPSEDSAAVLSESTLDALEDAFMGQLMSPPLTLPDELPAPIQNIAEETFEENSEGFSGEILEEMIEETAEEVVQDSFVQAVDQEAESPSSPTEASPFELESLVEALNVVEPLEESLSGFEEDLPSAPEEVSFEELLVSSEADVPLMPDEEALNVMEPVLEESLSGFEEDLPSVPEEVSLEELLVSSEADVPLVPEESEEEVSSVPEALPPVSVVGLEQSEAALPSPRSVHQAGLTARPRPFTPLNVMTQTNGMSTSSEARAFDRPDAVVLLIFVSIYLIWQMYLEFLEEAAPDGSLNGRSLARRLEVSPSLISRRKERDDFSAWTQDLDPDGIPWAYVDGVFVPLFDLMSDDEAEAIALESTP
jgi:hypothetical protein